MPQIFPSSLLLMYILFFISFFIFIIKTYWFIIHSKKEMSISEEKILSPKKTFAKELTLIKW